MSAIEKFDVRKKLIKKLLMNQEELIEILFVKS